MINRLDYVARTLSRTKRKDYENYVINAVWNRLDTATRAKLKPVSQQTVRTDDGRLFYVDLYFPQINVAVECDEVFHTRQIEADAERQTLIAHALAPSDVDVFTTISAVATSAYEVKHVAVPGDRDRFASRDDEAAVRRTLTLATIDETIGRVVDDIERRAADVDARAWDELDLSRDPARFYATRDRVTIDDGVVFSTIAEISNVLFRTEYTSGRMRSYFTPATLKITKGAAVDLSQYKLWCPKLVSAAGANPRWSNTLSSSGDEILEQHSEPDGDGQDGHALQHPRLTFVRAKDPVTREAGLRFVGVFEFAGTEGTAVRYRRSATEFALPKR